MPRLLRLDSAIDPDRSATRALTDELLAADVVVIGAPKYNYAMASTLKAWVDHIHVPGATTGAVHPMAGRPVIMTAQG